MTRDEIVCAKYREGLLIKDIAAVAKSAYWTSLDHAGGGPVVGRFRKARGVRKGLPDVMVLHQGRALFLELKAEKGTLSESQRECHKALNYAGASVFVVRSIEDVQFALESSSIQPRARVA